MAISSAPGWRRYGQTTFGKLWKDFARHAGGLAEVIVNICGNVIVGQANGELAKQVSDCLGKTLQDRESISINSNVLDILESVIEGVLNDPGCEGLVVKKK